MLTLFRQGRTFTIRKASRMQDWLGPLWLLRMLYLYVKFLFLLGFYIFLSHLIGSILALEYM
ncbi:hypothetical protein C8J56DRAFT_193391 [Mycena floridula]|nr:hypothetical protein C8J56DRAFT_193391 [Mycena floridula]